MTRAPEGSEDGLVRLAEYHATRCPRLQASLIDEYYWIVDYVARRYQGRGEPRDDIAQVAAMGLVAALERYDPATGGSFASFAIPTALGEVRRHFRDRTWRVRVPRGVKELAVQVNSIVDELTGDLGRLPTEDEIADRIGVSADAVRQARVAGSANNPLTVDARGTSEDSTAIIDLRAEDRDAAGLDVDSEMVIRDLIDSLPARDRSIVRMRYFEDLSQDEIAERVGISQPHVSRLLRSSLSWMREHLSDVQ